MKKHRPNCHHTPEKLAKNPPGVQCKCFCTCPEEEISNPTPSEASYGAHKTSEEIIAEFDERFMYEHCNNTIDTHLIVRSFLTKSLAAYRLSVLSECEKLVGKSVCEEILGKLPKKIDLCAKRSDDKNVCREHEHYNQAIDECREAVNKEKV